MNFFQFKTIRLKYLKRFFLSSGAISVRLPISLNIVGKVYHLETSMISREYIYIKVYEEDFEFLPSSYSHLVLFMNLDLFSNGKFDLQGKLVTIDRLGGSRLGLWISYQAETEKEIALISEFVRNHYTPRYSVRFDVEINSGIKFFRAEAINLSEKGIFIEGPIDQLAERDMCNLVLHLENLSLSINAEVSWINRGKMYDKPNGYGLKFFKDKQAERKILKYLKLLKNRSEILR